MTVYQLAVDPPRANVGLATAAAVFVAIATLFGTLMLTLPDVNDLSAQYTIRDAYDLQAAYEDVRAQHAGFNFLMLVFCSIPDNVLWLLMALNQMRMVEHLLKNGAELNRGSALIEG